VWGSQVHALKFTRSRISTDQWRNPAAADDAVIFGGNEISRTVSLIEIENCIIGRFNDRLYAALKAVFSSTPTDHFQDCGNIIGL
jgi:hypothetical protein